MSSLLRPPLLLILLLPNLAQPASLQLSADVALSVDATSVPDHGYLLDDGNGVVGQVSLPQLPTSADLDALEIGVDDSVLVSLDQPALVGGVYAEPGDALRCRYGNCQLVFDASVAGLPAGIDLDAIASRNGRLLLSFAAQFTQAPLGLIRAQDAVEFDGTQFSAVVFSGAAEGVPANANLDALHAHADGSLLLSFDRSLVVGGLAVFDHDIVRFLPATHQFSLHRALAGEHAAWWPADLDAIAGAAVGDRLFLDSFE